MGDLTQTIKRTPNDDIPIPKQKIALVKTADLSIDKIERNNLAATRPEKVKELEGALSLWEKTLVPPRWPSNGFFVNEVEGKEDRFTL